MSMLAMGALKGGVGVEVELKAMYVESWQPVTPMQRMALWRCLEYML